MENKCENDLFLNGFDNVNDIQNEHTWKDTLEKWKEVIFQSGLLHRIMVGAFFCLCEISSLFFAWQFNGNVNMKSQRSVPKIIAKTRFGWYFCSMSVHHCRPIRWWTGGGMTWSYIAKKKKIETHCLIEMLMLSLKILQVSLLIIILEKFVFHSDDDWHIEWMRQFREKTERPHTHTHIPNLFSWRQDNRRHTKKENSKYISYTKDWQAEWVSDPVVSEETEKNKESQNVK